MKELMVQVERAVRPVRAGARRKDRMREELLAHLTSIYEEEGARLGDLSVAREAALGRFGEPTALTHALEESLTRQDRVIWFIERWIGWRTQESEARHMLRLAGAILGLLGAFALVVVAAWLTQRIVNQMRGVQYLPLVLLSQAALVAIGTGAVFFLGLLYFKMRDALCGSLGACRALMRVWLYGALFGLVVLASGLAIVLPFAVLLGPSGALEVCLEIVWPWWYVIALVSPLFAALYGRYHGPTEIRHTEWACLELEVGRV
jgi:hypothetical protein